jgi:hypothetical protein
MLNFLIKTDELWLLVLRIALGHNLLAGNETELNGCLSRLMKNHVCLDFGTKA